MDQTTQLPFSHLLSQPTHTTTSGHVIRPTGVSLLKSTRSKPRLLEPRDPQGNRRSDRNPTPTPQKGTRRFCPAYTIRKKTIKSVVETKPRSETVTSRTPAQPYHSRLHKLRSPQTMPHNKKLLVEVSTPRQGSVRPTAFYQKPTKQSFGKTLPVVAQFT